MVQRGASAIISRFFAAVMRPLACHWLIFLGCALARRIDLTGRHKGNASAGYQECEIDVVFENDTPQEVEQVAIVHKYLGVTPTNHAVIFKNVAPFTMTKKFKVHTVVGAGAGHYDWWLMTWQYKRTPGLGWSNGSEYQNIFKKMGCQKCTKPNGKCETWMNSPGNWWFALFNDPMTYVKAAMLALNIGLSTLTLGVGSAIGIGLAELVTEGVAGAVLGGEDTSDFTSCNLNWNDLTNSYAHGVPVRIRLHRGRSRAQFINIDKFHEGTKEDVKDVVGRVSRNLEFRDIGATLLVNPGWFHVPVYKSLSGVGEIRTMWREEIIAVADAPRKNKQGQVMVPVKPNGYVELKHFRIFASSSYQSCRIEHHHTLPCRSDPSAVEGLEVKVQIHNKLERKITRIAVVHKFNGLTPRVRIRDFGGVEARSNSRIESVRTLTGFGFHADHWLVAWTDSENDCLVKSSMEPDFIEKLLNNPAKPLTSIATSAADTLLKVKLLGNAVDWGGHGAKHSGHANFSAANITGSAPEELFGIQMASILSKGTSTEGYFTCSMRAKDVEESKKNRPAQIWIISGEDGDKVSVRLEDRTCTMPAVVLRCLQTPECLSSQVCKSLKPGQQGQEGDSAKEMATKATTGIVNAGIGELLK